VFTYRPLAVAEPFGAGEAARLPLRELVEAAGAELRQDVVAAVEPENKTVELEGGDEVAWRRCCSRPGRSREAVPEAPPPGASNAKPFARMCA
jgi:hypothetical protein